MDDDDEVLLALAESLGDFVDLIGGSAYAHLLLNPLEQLCHCEDSGIREKAVDSFRKIITKMDIKKNESAISGVIKKLVTGDHHSAKASAAIIIPIIFALVSPGNQAELSQ
jgi:serine/threonine-protein phosphatase 2A regulatory subunit A